MKRNTLTWLMVLATGIVCALPARAQNFAIDWFTIAGGGGDSTGGVYSVSATIGQPEAGIISGGTFSVSGGFWSAVAEPTPVPAPRLSIRLSSPNTVVISWSATAGFELEQTADLSPANWSPVNTPPETVGTELQVIVQAPAGHRFYRLLKRP